MHVQHTHAQAHTQTHRVLGCYTVEIPELDFPSSPVSLAWEQGGGGVKLAAGRLLSKDDTGDGEGGSRVGLLMSPSPMRVRSVLASSSTVRRVGRVSEGRRMGDMWVPKVGWRGGGMRHRLECPFALELREESRLSERRLEVRGLREGMPFSRTGFRELGVEQARSEDTETEEVGGVSRRKSGSTRSSLFRRPRWSLARVLCARLSSSKNSGKQFKHISSLESFHTHARKGLAGCDVQQSNLAPLKRKEPSWN